MTGLHGKLSNQHICELWVTVQRACVWLVKNVTRPAAQWDHKLSRPSQHAQMLQLNHGHAPEAESPGRQATVRVAWAALVKASEQGCFASIHRV